MPKIELIQGDCLEKMKDIPDGSIDMILCDLPYGTTACKWDTIIPFEPLWKEYKRVIKDRGCIALFGSEPFSSYLRMSNIKNYKYDWIWLKNKPSGFGVAKFQPMKNHEIISCFGNLINYYPIKEERSELSKKRLKQGNLKTRNFGSNYVNMKEQLEGKKVEELRNPTTVKSFDMPSNNCKLFHPTQKPVALLEYLIKTYTLENETILDNCMGSGSTGVACKNLNRNFIGIELDPEYFKIAEKRINENL